MAHDTLIVDFDVVRTPEENYEFLKALAWNLRDVDPDVRRRQLFEAIETLDIPCPHCGQVWPWMYVRDPATKQIIDCTHEVVYVF